MPAYYTMVVPCLCQMPNCLKGRDTWESILSIYMYAYHAISSLSFSSLGGDGGEDV